MFNNYNNDRQPSSGESANFGKHTVGAQNAGNSPQNAETGAKDVQNLPDALIKDLYKTHEKDAGAVLNGKNRTLIDILIEDKTNRVFFATLRLKQEK